VQHAIDSARTDSIEKIAAAARADSIARVDSIAKADAAAKAKAKAAAKKAPAAKTKTAKAAPAPAKSGGAWSAQVAAYDARDEADRLASRMKERGYDVRVTGEKPFRVRIGRYARREDANDLVAKLKEAKITAIVVEAEKP
jgi:cell division protein FtsN